MAADSFYNYIYHNKEKVSNDEPTNVTLDTTTFIALCSKTTWAPNEVQRRLLPEEIAKRHMQFSDELQHPLKVQRLFRDLLGRTSVASSEFMSKVNSWARADHGEQNSSSDNINTSASRPSSRDRSMTLSLASENDDITYSELIFMSQCGSSPCPFVHLYVAESVKEELKLIIETIGGPEERELAGFLWKHVKVFSSLPADNTTTSTATTSGTTTSALSAAHLAAGRERELGTDMEGQAVEGGPDTCKGSSVSSFVVNPTPALLAQKKTRYFDVLHSSDQRPCGTKRYGTHKYRERSDDEGADDGDEGNHTSSDEESIYKYGGGSAKRCKVYSENVINFIEEENTDKEEELEDESEKELEFLVSSIDGNRAGVPFYKQIRQIKRLQKREAREREKDRLRMEVMADMRSVLKPTKRVTERHFKIFGAAWKRGYITFTSDAAFLRACRMQRVDLLALGLVVLHAPRSLAGL